jgi:hypothetical protein
MSTEKPADPAQQYLRTLAKAARALPRERRDELIQDVRSHIEVALAEAGNESRTGTSRSTGTGSGTGTGTGTNAGSAENAYPASTPDPESVRAVLAGLGDPHEIVMAALTADQGETAPIPPGMSGLELAAVPLLLFGAVLAGFGWLVGLLLLWASPRWTLRDKLLGTFILPGGMVGPIVVALAASNSTSALAKTALVLALIAPLVTAWWLVKQAKTALIGSASPRWGVALGAVAIAVVSVPVLGVVLFAGSSAQEASQTPAVAPSVLTSVSAVRSPGPSTS